MTPHVYLPAEAGERERHGEACEVVRPIEVGRYPDEWTFLVRFEGREIEAFASELDPVPPVPGEGAA